MKHQRGVALTGLILWGVVLFIAAVLGMKVVPSVIEYFKIKKDIQAVVEKAAPTATVPELRSAFEKFAQVDQLSFPSKNLDIFKNSRGQVVIEFAYDQKIPLFANVSLLIEYKGSTAE